MAEDEKVHPLVSNLLEQAFVPRIAGEVFRYDRDEMMRLKTVPLSVTRPENLSVEFDGDDGKFSPFKWLEHRWEVEGIKNRPTNKKLQDALRADCDENAGLSPQRRGFSGGCRAPTEEKKDREINSLVSKDDGWSTVDSPKERLFAASSSKWRPGSTTSEKFNSAKGNEFKLPFQRTMPAVDKTAKTGWKTIEGKERQSGSFSTTGKFLPARSYRGTDERGEKIPEWADDPTTMDDMIELKGFEEPTKKKKGAKTENRAKSGTNSRSSPTPFTKEKPGSDKALLESLGMASEPTPIPLPDTDAELAAILGLMDLPPGLPNPASTNATASSTISGLSGSRMSKFFNRGRASGDPTASEGSTQLSVTDEVASNPALAKLFSQGSTGRGSPQTVPKNNQSVRPLRLEDLERNFTVACTDDLQQKQTQADDVVKGNLLQDPQQQAQLLQKLHKVARQQEEGKSSASPPLQRHAAQPGMAPTTSNFPIPGMVPQIPPEHILMAQAQHLLAIQLQQAYPGGVPQIAPHILERMRNDLIRNIIARHQQLQNIMANANLQQHAAAAVQQAKTVRPAMIPASVQRQMSKAVTVEEKRDKDREEEDSAMRQQAEIFKKQQMQQQYNVLMNAMQNGLPMAAIRQGTTPVAQSPNPQQLQAIMAAQAQAQQLQRIAYMQKQQQQQHAAMMKLVAIQQQQQQVQHNGESERTQTAPAGNGNNDILQVGPIQTPLEKLLTAAGVQPSQFNPTNGSMMEQPGRMMGAANFSGTRPMSLEEVERNIANNVPPLPSTVRPMSLEELERHLTEKSNKLT